MMKEHGLRSFVEIELSCLLENVGELHIQSINVSKTELSSTTQKHSKDTAFCRQL